MINNLNLIILLIFLIFAASAQSPIQPAEIITLKSTPASADMIWKGGERTIISELVKFPTVSNVSVPIMLAYLPEPSKANGTALIIAACGGFHSLSIDNKGNFWRNGVWNME